MLLRKYTRKYTYTHTGIYNIHVYIIYIYIYICILYSFNHDYIEGFLDFSFKECTRMNPLSLPILKGGHTMLPGKSGAFAEQTRPQKAKLLLLFDSDLNHIPPPQNRIDYCKILQAVKVSL